MIVLVSGSTGLVGSELTRFLSNRGHVVKRLVRKDPTGEADIYWDVVNGRLDAAALEGIDAVVHLAGENIGESKWTAERKKRIRESRLKGTSLLSDTLARLIQPPKVFVSASALGFYGERGDEILTEDAAPGNGFLSELCREWEGCTSPVAEKGIRVALTRFGLILSPKGGMLARILTPFKLGAGGKIGSGDQYMSWIAIDDVVGALNHILHTESLSGPVNVSAPNPVTNKDFTRVLAKVLRRPAIFPVPAMALRIAFGEMADQLLLAGTRLYPEKLLKSGYEFLYPDLEAALYHLLAR